MKKLILLLIFLLITGWVYPINAQHTCCRFYLNSTGEAAIPPVTPSAGWDDTTIYATYKLNAVPSGSPMTTISRTSTANETILHVQYISDPILETQTISGEVKGQLRSADDSAAKASWNAMSIFLVSNDGTVNRGALLALNKSTGVGVSATENPYSADGGATGLVNRFTPSSGEALTPVAAQDGDRIVVELGHFKAGGGITTYLSTGDDSLTDLPTDETTTAAYNPWIEFSTHLRFKQKVMLIDF